MIGEKSKCCDKIWWESANCKWHQEALCCKSLKIENVVEVVIKTVNLIWSRGLNHCQFDSLLREKDHNYGLPNHTEVRRLSRGAVLRRFFDLQEETEQFMERKGKPVLEFQSTHWMQDLAFLVDVTEHMNNLNKILQGRNKVVTRKVSSITTRWLCLPQLTAVMLLCRITAYVRSSWSCHCGRRNPRVVMLLTFLAWKICARPNMLQTWSSSKII